MPLLWVLLGVGVLYLLLKPEKAKAAESSAFANAPAKLPSTPGQQILSVDSAPPLDLSAPSGTAGGSFIAITNVSPPSMPPSVNIPPDVTPPGVLPPSPGPTQTTKPTPPPPGTPGGTTIFIPPTSKPTPPPPGTPGGTDFSRIPPSSTVTPFVTSSGATIIPSTAAIAAASAAKAIVKPTPGPAISIIRPSTK
jgi:hypothetical protein